MKIKGFEVRSAIVITSCVFTELVHTLYGKDVEIEYSLDGLWVGCSDGEFDIEDKLSEYFGVKVTEIHLNNDGYYSEVWIAYED